MSKPMSEWRKVAFGSSGAGLLMEDEYARALTVVGLVGECPDETAHSRQGDCKHVDTSLLTVQLYHGHRQGRNFYQMSQPRQASGFTSWDYRINATGRD